MDINKQPKPTEQPPPGHDKALDNFTRALAVPKSEIDRRESEWRKHRDENKAKKELPQ